MALETETPKTLTVRLVRSPIGYQKDQRETARLLGLRRLRAVATHPDTPVVRGMIRKIAHLVEVLDAPNESAAEGRGPAEGGCETLPAETKGRSGEEASA